MKLFKNFIKKYFFSGILILLPILLTIWLFSTLILTLDKLVFPLIRFALPEHIEELLILKHLHGYGLIITFILIIVAGFIGRNFIGQYFIKKLESLIKKLPLIPTVYNAIKDILGTFIGTNQSQYNSVVLLEYPRKGLYTLAFITGEADPSFNQQSKFYNIFVPTTPNPTSGFFLMAKEDEFTRIDIPVEKAVKLIMSCGIVREEKNILPEKHL